MHPLGAITPQLVDPAINGFRLTLESGVPVSTSDQTGKTTLYVTPFKSDRMAVWNGSAWIVRESAEFSKALGTLSSGVNYDVFVYDNAGTLTVDSFVAWTNDTTRATAIVRQDGVWVKDGDATRRYVGTFRTTSTTATEDSEAKRFLWSAESRVPRSMKVVEATNTWTYTTAAFRAANNSASNRLQYVQGLAEEPVEAEAVAVASSDTGSVWISAGVGVDSTTVNSAQTLGTGRIPAADQGNWCRAFYRGSPGIGFHFLQWLEYSSASGVTTWQGDAGVTFIQSGITGEVFA